MSGMRLTMKQLSPSLRQQAIDKLGEKALAKFRKPKYGNRRTMVDGAVFDSAKEARRWQELVLLAIAGKITDLERQVAYSLEVNGVEICTYIADFRYRQDRKLVVEDIKGWKRGIAYRVFKIKSALMKALHRINVLET